MNIISMYYAVEQKKSTIWFVLDFDGILSMSSAVYKLRRKRDNLQSDECREWAKIRELESQGSHHVVIEMTFLCPR